MGADRLSELSPRQLQCLQLVARHNTTEMGAYLLGLSPKTFDAHVAAGLAKLGLTSRRAAAQLLIEHDASTTEKSLRVISLVDSQAAAETGSAQEPDGDSGLQDAPAELPDEYPAPEVADGISESEGMPANDLTKLQRLALIATIAACIAIILIAVQPLAAGYQALANFIEPFHAN